MTSPTLITRRYMWTYSDQNNDDGSPKIFFKIVTDTPAGLSEFELKFKDAPNLVRFGYEYVCEYSVSQLGLFTPVYSYSENSPDSSSE